MFNLFQNKTVRILEHFHYQSQIRLPARGGSYRVGLISGFATNLLKSIEAAGAPLTPETIRVLAFVLFLYCQELGKRTRCSGRQGVQPALYRLGAISLKDKQESLLSKCVEAYADTLVGKVAFLELQAAIDIELHCDKNPALVQHLMECFEILLLGAISSTLYDALVLKSLVPLVNFVDQQPAQH